MPLSPRFVKPFGAPVSARAAFGQAITAAKALPVNFWQSRQWQSETNFGAASAR